MITAATVACSQRRSIGDKDREQAKDDLSTAPCRRSLDHEHLNLGDSTVLLGIFQAHKLWVSRFLPLYERFVLAGGREHADALYGAIRDSVNAALSDTHRATLCGVDLRGLAVRRRQADNDSTWVTWAGLTGVNLQWADFRNADLTNLALSHANLADANLDSARLDSTWLSNATLTGARMWFAHLAYTHWRNVDARWVDLSRAVFKNASLEGVDLSNSLITRTVLDSVDLTATDFTDVFFTPDTVRSVVLSGVRGLSSVRFFYASGVEQLRDQLVRQDEPGETRALTAAITKHELANSGFADRAIQGIVLGGYLTDYKAAPSRCLFAVFVLVPVFAVFYRWQAKKGSLLVAWIGNPRRKAATTMYRRPVLHFARVRSRLTWIALYFSLQSAVSLNFQGVSVAGWIRQLQRRDYELIPVGFARTISGVQSLVTLYLLSIWILAYFH